MSTYYISDILTKKAIKCFSDDFNYETLENMITELVLVYWSGDIERDDQIRFYPGHTAMWIWKNTRANFSFSER